MAQATSDDVEHENWYKYGKLVLYTEMLIAIGVTVFSLYLAFNGQAAGIA
jgi:hypothetical protein